MSKFEKFHYATRQALEAQAQSLGVRHLHFSEDTACLREPVRIGQRLSPNSIAILPMEGCDCDEAGRPGNLTVRRYTRFAEGGAGLIWFEACAVVDSGRANPRQMCISPQTVESLRRLLDTMRDAAVRRNGYAPLAILQLTHSGRWARPVDVPAPVVTHHDPYLDPVVGIDESYPVITDDELDALMEQYVQGACLAEEAGFDGVDFKISHRYLLSELLAAFTRPGKYGGSFENRTRFVMDGYRRIRQAVGADMIVGMRLGLYDAHPYPYGWGVDRKDMWQPDLTEPLRLIDQLRESGIDMMNASLGNTYYKYPYVTRPYDAGTAGAEPPVENPLEGIERIFALSAAAKAHLPGVPLVGSGYSWLRQYMFEAGAANKKAGLVDMIGMGRMALAYPEAPRDLFRNGALDPSKCCIACSRCTQLMRDHGQAGCVCRDQAVYAPLYRKYREQARQAEERSLPR